MKTAFNTEILENSLFHFPAHSCFCIYLRRIQNFLGGSANPKGGMPTYYFGHFIPQKCMKLKKYTEKGCTPLAPLLRSPNVEDVVNISQSIGLLL